MLRALVVNLLLPLSLSITQKDAVVISDDGTALLRHSIVRRDDHFPNGPESINAYDLWAIHDLLLVGHHAPLLRGEDGKSTAHPGLGFVEGAADSLAAMLHEIHPVSACREAIGSVNSLEEKAKASWTCLDVDTEDFKGAFTDPSQKADDVSHTTPKFQDKLGACRESGWARACSYWASMHSMAVRAEMLNKGQEFVQAVTRIIAGGALYCFGCTYHFIYVNKNFLPAELGDISGLWEF